MQNVLLSRRTCVMITKVNKKGGGYGCIENLIAIPVM